MNDLRPDIAAVGIGDQEEAAELQAKKKPHFTHTELQPLG